MTILVRGSEGDGPDVEDKDRVMMALPFGQEGVVGLGVYEKFVRDHMLVGRRDCPFLHALQGMLAGGQCHKGMRKAKLYW